MEGSEESPESHSMHSSAFYGLLLVALVVAVLAIIYIAHHALHTRPIPDAIGHQIVRFRTTAGLGRDAVENIPTVEFHAQPAPNKAPKQVWRHSSLRGEPPASKPSILHVSQRHPDVSPRSLESGAGKPQEVSPLCSICTEDFIEGTRLRKLPCGHVFHPQCIDLWLMDRARTCPLWSVSPDQTRAGNQLT